MAKVSILALGNKAELTLSCAASASGLISQLAGLVAVKLAQGPKCIGRAPLRGPMVPVT